MQRFTFSSFENYRYRFLSYFDYILRPIGTNASLSLTKLKRFMKNISMEKIMIPISNMISKKKTSYGERLAIKKRLSTVPSLSTINKFKLLTRFRLKFIQLIYQHCAGNYSNFFEPPSNKKDFRKNSWNLLFEQKKITKRDSRILDRSVDNCNDWTESKKSNSAPIWFGGFLLLNV